MFLVWTFVRTMVRTPEGRVNVCVGISFKIGGRTYSLVKINFRTIPRAVLIKASLSERSTNLQLINSKTKCFLTKNSGN